VLAEGGNGGFGNAHFKSSTNRAPRNANPGQPGEERWIWLRLKLIADAGLLGLPNAGKSTLLSKISNARPEIADYPFTTLTPNLGVVDIGDSSILVADIPGLIEGAAEGKGLGHDFLRHVERTAVILHLVDAYQEDVAAAYQTVKNELQAYQAELLKRPEIIALNKVEGLDEEIINDLLNQLQTVASAKTPVFAISAAAGTGLDKLLYEVQKTVQKERTKAAKKAEKQGVPVLTLADTPGQWHITKEGDGFVVSGARIEQFAGRTDFDNEEAVQRLRDIMKKMGIMHELIRQGIKPGQLVKITSFGSFEY